MPYDPTLLELGDVLADLQTGRLGRVWKLPLLIRRRMRMLRDFLRSPGRAEAVSGNRLAQPSCGAIWSAARTAMAMIVSCGLTPSGPRTVLPSTMNSPGQVVCLVVEPHHAGPGVGAHLAGPQRMVAGEDDVRGGELRLPEPVQPMARVEARLADDAGVEAARAGGDQDLHAQLQPALEPRHVGRE